MRKKYEGKASKKARGVINHIRSKNNKKYHVELDFDEHECEKMLKQPCHYCGRTPTGFDRIDSRYGYYKANIVPCCRACNIFKMDYTYDDFKENVIRIYNN
jgi:hypothetical protein